MNSDTKQMTIPELIEAIVPFIQKEQYSDGYISGLTRCFIQFEKYCAEREITQLTAEVAQQFLQERYGLQPGTVDRRLSRNIRAMDMLSDFRHCGAVMTRRSLDKNFPDV